MQPILIFFQYLILGLRVHLGVCHDFPLANIRPDAAVVLDPGVSIVMGAQEQENKAAVVSDENQAIAVDQMECMTVFDSGFTVFGQLAALLQVHMILLGHVLNKQASFFCLVCGINFAVCLRRVACATS